MNLKQILCLAAIAGVSSHAFAFEIYHGRVISEKTWSTDGKKVMFAKSSLRNRTDAAMPQDQELGVYLPSATGKAGEPVTLSGRHNIYITNNSATNQTYFYNVSVCAFLDDHTSHCVYQTKNLELDPNGSFRADEEPELTLTFSNPGNYQTTASTWVRGAGNGNGYMNAISSVTIS